MAAAGESKPAGSNGLVLWLLHFQIAWTIKNTIYMYCFMNMFGCVNNLSFCRSVQRVEFCHVVEFAEGSWEGLIPLRLFPVQFLPNIAKYGFYITGHKQAQRVLLRYSCFTKQLYHLQFYYFSITFFLSFCCLYKCNSLETVASSGHQYCVREATELEKKLYLWYPLGGGNTNLRMGLLVNVKKHSQSDMSHHFSLRVFSPQH